MPALLTVEEAAALLRVGRTKAYAMAKEWRETDGRCGLPVVDLGGVLRVVLSKLEDMVGGPLTGTVPDRAGWSRARDTGTRPRVAAQPRPRTRSPRTTGRANPSNQLSLINPTEA